MLPAADTWALPAESQTDRVTLPLKRMRDAWMSLYRYLIFIEDDAVRPAVTYELKSDADAAALLFYVLADVPVGRRAEVWREARLVATKSAGTGHLDSFQPLFAGEDAEKADD